MNITRHNYEECFLLYIDNELSLEDRKAVEMFVRQNPDLEEELAMFRQSVLHPDKKEIFSNKELLLKNPDFINPVNESNYEEYFVLYGDNELSNEQNDYVELFVYKYPQFQQEFELIQKAKLVPDTLVAFPDKTRLYRKEKADRVIVITWWRVAAAAIVLLFMGALGWNVFIKSPGNKQTDAGKPAIAVTDKPKKDNRSGSDNVNPPAVKKDDLAVSTESSDKTITRKENNTKKSVSENVARISHQPKSEERDVAIIPVKEFKSDGNLHTDQTVTQSNNPINVPNPGKETRSIAMNANKPIVDTEVGFDKLDKNDGGLATYAVNDNNNQTEVLNTSVNNKNKLRGFFRKVTRVIGRTTNLGSDDENKGLHIASFEIALK